MRSITLGLKESQAPADLRVGERVVLIRGDGPRDGAFMGYATITANDENGLTFYAEYTAERSGDEMASESETEEGS